MDIVIGVIRKNNKFLLIQRAKKEGLLEWAFPGGKVEKGETKQEALRREVFEETKIDIANIKFLGNRIHPNTAANITYFSADFFSGKIKTNKSEVISAKWLSPKQILNLITTDIFPPVKEFLSLKNNLKN